MMYADEADAVKPSSDAIATARRRRVPCFVIVDTSGEIVLRPGDLDATADSLFPGDVIRALIAEIDDTAQTEAYALAAPTVVLRAVPLESFRNVTPARFYAVSLEYVESRDLLNNAAQQYGLSVREIDVFRHVLQGLSTAQIADRLCIATTTVHAHVKNIARKTHSSKRTEILAKLIGVR